MATTTTWYDQQEYMEKRQLFLRSYQFSRRQTTVERICKSLSRFRRMVVRRFGAIRKAKRVVWSGLRRHVICCCWRSFRHSFSRHQYNGGGGGVVEYNAAREWFGTPCHWASWTSTSSTTRRTTRNN